MVFQSESLHRNETVCQFCDQEWRGNLLVIQHGSNSSWKPLRERDIVLINKLVAR